MFLDSIPFPPPQGPWLGQGFTFICSYLVSIHSTPLPSTSRITVLKITHPSLMLTDFLELPSASRASPPAPLTLWLLPGPAASPASTSLFLTSHSAAPSLYTTLCLISEKAMAPHSSTLAWKIPWAEEPGGLQSMGSRRVGDTTERLHYHYHYPA